jgi:hypothetical protein
MPSGILVVCLKRSADFSVPQDLDLLALGIIGNAGELERGQVGLRVIDGLDQPLAPANLDEIPLFYRHSATTLRAALSPDTDDQN